MALKILQEADITKVSTWPPTNIKSNSIYLFKSEDNCTAADYKADRMKWRNKGKYPINRNRKTFETAYFQRMHGKKT